MDELDDKLQELAQAYHEPPEAPRERMWARIQAERAAQAAEARREPDVLTFRPRRTVPIRRVAAWAAGVAAVLLLGIAIGRGTRGEPIRSEMAQAPAITPQPATTNASSEAVATNVALDAAVQAHLRQAEAYLTLFRASVRSGETDHLALPAARELLATNRILVGAPGMDPRRRELMLDLELVLVGISQLQASGRPADIQLITDGLDQAGMLTRLRSAAPRDRRPLPTGVI